MLKSYRPTICGKVFQRLLALWTKQFEGREEIRRASLTGLFVAKKKLININYIKSDIWIHFLNFVICKRDVTMCDDAGIIINYLFIYHYP